MTDALHEEDEDHDAMMAYGDGLLIAVALEEDEARVSALHEAGHAVACVMLGRAIRYVTMRGRPAEPGGAPVPRVMVHPSFADAYGVRRRPGFYRSCALIGIAGPMVECRNAGVAGFRRAASQADLEQVVRYVDAVHQPDTDDERHQIIDGLAVEVEPLLDQWRDSIERVADELLRRGRLTHAEVTALCAEE